MLLASTPGGGPSLDSISASTFVDALLRHALNLTTRAYMWISSLDLPCRFRLRSYSPRSPQPDRASIVGTIAPDDKSRQVQGSAPRVSSTRVPALDGIRAYAILVVVLRPSARRLRRASRARGDGPRGRHLGRSSATRRRLLHHQRLRPLPSGRPARRGVRRRVGFWIGRGARLLPAFWLVLAITLLLAAIHPPLPGYRFPALCEIAANAAVLQMPRRGSTRRRSAIGFGDRRAALAHLDRRRLLRGPAVHRAPLVPAPADRPRPIAAASRSAGRSSSADPRSCCCRSRTATSNLIRLLGVDQFPGWAFSFGLGMTGAWAYVPVPASAGPRSSCSALRRAGAAGRPAVLRRRRLPARPLRARLRRQRRPGRPLPPVRDAVRIGHAGGADGRRGNRAGVDAARRSPTGPPAASPSSATAST